MSTYTISKSKIIGLNTPKVVGSWLRDYISSALISYVGCVCGVRRMSADDNGYGPGRTGRPATPRSEKIQFRHGIIV